MCFETVKTVVSLPWNSHLAQAGREFLSVFLSQLPEVTDVNHHAWLAVSLFSLQFSGGSFITFIY